MKKTKRFWWKFTFSLFESFDDRFFGNVLVFLVGILEGEIYFWVSGVYLEFAVLIFTFKFDFLFIFLYGLEEIVLDLN